MDVDTVGMAAFLISLVYTGIGLPAQILANHRRKAMHGLSLFMNVILMFTFSIWIIYGSMKADWYIVGSNAPGLACIVIILFQFYIYRPAIENTLKDPI